MDDELCCRAVVRGVGVAELLRQLPARASNTLATG